MSLVLRVDGDRWRAHLREVHARYPGLVPVAKGNGYGFGLHRLARKAQWLGVDTVAVGMYAELPEVSTRYNGSMLVLTPWRSADPMPNDTRVIHTVGRLEELTVLAEHGRATGTWPRVVLERLTSLRRHGFSASGLRDAVALVAAHGGVEVEGVALHLPLAGLSHAAEAARLMTDVVSTGIDTLAGAGARTVWVSHLCVADLAELAAAYPKHNFRPRMGTDLWLGAPDALSVVSTVLDVHAVARGDVYGYRGRAALRAGTILVVSGGTAHGIGLESPTGRLSLTTRAATVARGGLDAAGFVRSPFSVDGKARRFAEPPHMQASMVFLPAGAAVPSVGDLVSVRVRLTATWFDEVTLS